MKRTNNNAYYLATVNAISKIYDVFLGTFLVAYLFKQTQDSSTEIGIYHLICYFIVGLSAYLTGNWLKKKNRILMYQLGVVITFIYLTSFIILKENIINYIPICAIFYGLYIAFMSFPFNLIIADNIPNSQLIPFQGYLESLKNIIKVCSPIILGYFLNKDSYFNTVAFLAFLSLIELILISRVKATPQKQSPDFNIKSFVNKTKNSKTLKQLYKIEFYRGMTLDGALLTLVTLYIVYLFKTNFSLGFINSIFYLLAIILSFIFGRCCKYTHFTKLLTIIAITIISALIAFTIYPNKTTFIIYSLCFTISTQFLRTIASINVFNISHLPQVKRNKCEYFAYREIFINLGRVVSFALVILIGIFNNFEMLKTLLTFLTIILIILCINCIRLNNRFYNKKRKN
jgi:hypothetical protein